MRGLLLACFAIAPLAAQEIRATQFVTGISAPTDIQNAADGTGRLFFVQQNGIIRVWRNGALAEQPFLDIRSKTRPQSERGLLGLAFPPGFAEKQRFYVNYTDLNGDTVIALYRVTSNPDIADPSSELVLLTIDQPFANHNGGQIRFGPDGYFYVGMGDGGSAGDPQGNGQNRNALLGKMLRIDVESEPGRVRVPPDNPFVNTPGARPEIWALGLRNPWRFTFDRATGDLWIADVGQNAWEEVNFQPAASRGGENYGWNRMEGMHCFRAGCDQQGLTLPVAEYGRSDGCSVTGGFVYRGASSPALRRTYLYGDYCSGRIWGVERQGNAWSNRLLLSSGFGITTFGEDESGEVYVANANNGTIYRIDGGAAPRVSPDAIVNAASFARGIVPGSLATVFGVGLVDPPGIRTADSLPLATALAGVSVTVNGIAAPIHSVANRSGQEQVNFQAPFEIRGRPTASVVVTRGGSSSAAVEVPVLDAQPAVFTSDGTNAVVVHNADFSLVTPGQPLAAGEFAFLYATGLGRAENEPASGAAAPRSPLATAATDVRVTLGGIPCEVQFAGLAPGFVGVFQVNFSVAATPSGIQDLVVTAGGTASPAVKVPAR